MAGPRGPGKGRPFDIQRPPERTIRLVVPEGTIDRMRSTLGHYPHGLPVEGRCLVCANAFLGEIKKCPKCETPHHAECWQYNQGCAIFGCKLQVVGEVPKKTLTTDVLSPTPIMPNLRYGLTIIGLIVLRLVLVITGRWPF